MCVVSKNERFFALYTRLVQRTQKKSSRNTVAVGFACATEASGADDA